MFERWIIINNLLSTIILLMVTASDGCQSNHGKRLRTQR